MSQTTKHYDVVVLGASIGALAAAALLARRSWRVLLLGQGWRRPMYSYDGLPIARRPFTFLPGASPAWGRVLAELAQSQTFRRRLSSVDPILQVLTPDMRLDVSSDAQLFAREIDREFPSVRRVIDDIYAELGRTGAAADAAFAQDVVWPPGGFWEKRETAKLLSTLPHFDGKDFLSELPREHAFRSVVVEPARFSSDLHDELPPFALARLYGSWTRGIGRLAEGESDLVDFLLDRIKAHGGDTRLNDRAREFVVEGGKVRGVLVDGESGPIGVSFVVSDMPSAAIFELARDGEFSVSEAEPEVDVAGARFVLSVVSRREGLPERLAREAFILPKQRRPLHLQVHDVAGNPDLALLVVEALISEHERDRLERLREEVLGSLLEFLPFIERHVLVCDSPNDGLPLWDFRGPTSLDSGFGERASNVRAQAIDRARLRATGGSLEPEPMQPRFRVTRPTLEGLGGEPIRTPIGNVFSVGKSVLPALGQEGELLAAWGVARIITRTDRRKEKMLREMWSKVELT